MSFLDEFTPKPAPIGVSNTPWGIKPLSGIADAMRKVREYSKTSMATQAMRAAELAESAPEGSVPRAEADAMLIRAAAEVLNDLSEADVEAAIQGLDDKPRKELRDILKSGFVPGSEGDKLFARLHKVECWDDPANSHSGNEEIFRASNITPARFERAAVQNPNLTEEAMIAIARYCIEEAAEKEGVKLTEEQRDEFVGWLLNAMSLTESAVNEDNVARVIADVALRRAMGEDISGTGVESDPAKSKALTGGLEGKGSKKPKGSKGLTSEELEFGEALIVKLKVLDDQSTVAVLESLNDAELHALIEASARHPQVRYRRRKLAQVDTNPTLSTRLRN
jgi:hypothetical protein